MLRSLVRSPLRSLLRLSSLSSLSALREEELRLGERSESAMERPLPIKFESSGYEARSEKRIVNVVVSQLHMNDDSVVARQG